MVKICKCALKDVVTKGNAGKQRKEGTEGQTGTGTEIEQQLTVVVQIGHGPFGKKEKNVKMVILPLPFSR